MKFTLAQQFAAKLTAAPPNEIAPSVRMNAFNLVIALSNAPDSKSIQSKLANLISTHNLQKYWPCETNTLTERAKYETLFGLRPLDVNHIFTLQTLPPWKILTQTEKRLAEDSYCLHLAQKTGHGQKTPVSSEQPHSIIIGSHQKTTACLPMQRSQLLAAIKTRVIPDTTQFYTTGPKDSSQQDTLMLIRKLEVRVSSGQSAPETFIITSLTEWRI